MQGNNYIDKEIGAIVGNILADYKENRSIDKLDLFRQPQKDMIISVLQDNGHELREPYSKHLSEGIFELRAQAGSDISRVLYFFYVDQHIILTNGFIKKTQKTPPQEIERAKKYRADYLSRRRDIK